MNLFRSIFKPVKTDMRFCDLHIHTVFSDGLLTPEQVVIKAKECGLSAIGIVDHDSIGGVEPAKRQGKKEGLEVVPAVEMSCVLGENDIHIIGYYIDYKNKKLKEFLADIQQKRVARAKSMVERLAKQGARVDWHRVLELAGVGSVGRPHIAQVLVEEGYVSCYDEAFWKFLGYHCPAYVPKEKLSPKEAIKLIRRFHGIPVLAHPMSYQNRAMISFLIDEGIVGLEVWRVEHTENEINFLLNLVMIRNLVAVGGSDCHGGRKGKILIGELKIPYQYLERLKHAR
ncbi:MAG: PHP domain-containing protein [candidate division WOR-3 bacterium]|nr:PHP domain-containing protein [candidate division WOR-3 bacterium]